MRLSFRSNEFWQSATENHIYGGRQIFQIQQLC